MLSILTIRELVRVSQCAHPALPAEDVQAVLEDDAVAGAERLQADTAVEVLHGAHGGLGLQRLEQLVVLPAGRRGASGLPRPLAAATGTAAAAAPRALG